MHGGNFFPAMHAPRSNGLLRSVSVFLGFVLNATDAKVAAAVVGESVSLLFNTKPFQ